MDRYEEALERAKAGKPMDEVFPELKESEDERVRKEMIDYFYGCIQRNKNSGFRVEQIKNWIAYLERQKEQKPAELSEDTMDEFTRNIRNLITDKLTVYTKGLDGSEMSSTVFIDDKTAKDIASGVLFYVGKEAIKNPNREIPEWCEEDVSIIVSRLKDAYEETQNEMFLEDIERIKSLRPQPKPEWSEEDETMWSNLIGYLEGKVGMLPSGKERYIKWLKERFVKLVYPKPSWKPSEEQMKWLESAVMLSTDKPHIHGIIISLYEQLKRL